MNKYFFTIVFNEENEQLHSDLMEEFPAFIKACHKDATVVNETPTLWNIEVSVSSVDSWISQFLANFYKYDI